MLPLPVRDATPEVRIKSPGASPDTLSLNVRLKDGFWLVRAASGVTVTVGAIESQTAEEVFDAVFAVRE